MRAGIRKVTRSITCRLLLYDALALCRPRSFLLTADCGKTTCKQRIRASATVESVTSWRPSFGPFVSCQNITSLTFQFPLTKNKNTNCYVAFSGLFCRAFPAFRLFGFSAFRLFDLQNFFYQQRSTIASNHRLRLLHITWDIALFTSYENGSVLAIFEKGYSTVRNPTRRVILGCEIQPWKRRRYGHCCA